MPAGLYILGALNILFGVSTVLVGACLLPEFLPAFLHPDGDIARDPASRFATLAIISGLVAGLVMTAFGTCLLIVRWKRRVAALMLAVAAAVAQAAMAAFALLGALLGHTRMGLLEAGLLVVVLPFAVGLLVLSACGAWYLKQSHIRRALGQTAAEDRPAV